ncbi:MAG: carbamoyltransferase C-terminal domain-containing protein [bacterium]|nr:carbamoyltransferase C-terminal domain-containing protein [bacterium]
MKILGLADGQYDSGACLFEDGAVAAAVNEERLNRIKMSSGFPSRSIAEVLRCTGTAPEEVDLIVVGSVASPPFIVRRFRKFQQIETAVRENKSYRLTAALSDFVKYRLRMTSYLPESRMGRIDRRLVERILRRDLPGALRRKPIRFVEHHRAHAASAYYCAGFPEALCVTSDSFGDGLSFTINLCRDRTIERVFSMEALNSFGKVYSLFTQYLGFKPNRHEGKILGLSAHGDWRRVEVPFPFRVVDGVPTYTERHGTYAARWLERFKHYSSEDIAAWLQHHTEREILALVRPWVERSGMRRLVLAGGVFANVRLNQKLAELPGVESVFIFPHMGDGGLGVGAVLDHLAPETLRLAHVYFGPEFGEREMAEAMRRRGASFREIRPIEPEIARLISEGKVVGRFNGRMEYGPRALGNRSILYHAKDPSVNHWLNKRLNRTEFMPFAPATLVERAAECYRDVDRNIHPAMFMTITFDCTDSMKRESPAAVHVDGTARPQLVSRESNASFYAIIDEYRKITGLPSIINTSYNMHEEPIVCSPDDAVRSFIEGHLDHLAMGPFLAENPKRNG